MQSEMKMFGGFDTLALKQHFGKKLMELEDEKKTVQVVLNTMETISIIMFVQFFINCLSKKKVLHLLLSNSYTCK